MPVQLLLPYIRPLRSKCFAGGILHIRGSGFKAGDLPVTDSSTGLACALARGKASPDAYSMCKAPERKDSLSRLGGTLADNRPAYFDAKRSKMDS